MAAVYPGSVRVFDARTDVSDILFAEHVNTLQDEVAALQTFLGTNPHVAAAQASSASYTNGATFGSVAARLANLEAGVVADVHTHYAKLAGGSTIQPAAAATRALTLRAHGTQSAPVFRVENAAGTTAWLEVASTGAVEIGTLTVGGFAVLTTNSPVSYGAVVAQTAYGLASGNGTATSLSRSDHTHGTPALSSATPAVLVYGSGSATAGTATAPARADHIHALPAAPTAASVGALALTGGTVTGTLNVTGTLQENGTRPYSADNPPPVNVAAPVPLSFHVGGSVATGLRAPKFIAEVNMTLRGARSITDAGAATYNIYVNGSNVSGAAAPAGTGVAHNDFANVDINVGDRVQLFVATADAAALELSVTVDAVQR